MLLTLKNLFTNGRVTVTDGEATAMTRANALPGAKGQRYPLAYKAGANNTVVVSPSDGPIDGYLHSIDAKGDKTVVMGVTGFVCFEYDDTTVGAPAVAYDRTGYVVGAGSGKVRCLAATVTVGLLTVQPKKVVSVNTTDKTVIVDLGAKIS